MPTRPYEGLVLVAGASGGVGRRVVQKLCRQGVAVRALVRDKTRGVALDLEKLGATIVEADLADPVSARVLPSAMQGVGAVISALGTRQVFSSSRGLRQVDYAGTRRLVDAARAAGVDYFVLNSTMGVYERRSLTRPFSILFYPKWEAEAYLVRSGLAYTIIRPGGLVDDDAALKGPPGWRHSAVFAETVLSGEGGFGSLGRVHRDDVAEALVKCLGTPAARNRIFDILDRASLKPAARSKILPGVFS